MSVSRERIRQIEVRAFEKLQNRMRELAQEKGLLRDLVMPSRASCPAIFSGGAALHRAILEEMA